MAKIARTDSDRQAQSLLRAVLLHALPIALLVLALLAYWFGRADRYLVFLYYHDMGPLVPDTSPFSPVTASRYWMSGLVAAGFVLVLYASLNWLVGRLREGYAPPPWALVWLICLPLLLLGIPLITMSLNSPVLPWDHAARVTLCRAGRSGPGVAAGAPGRQTAVGAALVVGRRLRAVADSGDPGPAR